MIAMPGSRSPIPALADFVLLNEEIAALVRARLPLEGNLALVGAELPKTAGALANRVAERMSAGATLPAAIEAECATLPPIYRATVVAGMESGQLNSVIESLVDTATRLDQLRRVTAIALLYPVIVITIAALAFALIITTVVPNFDWLNESHFGPLAWLARFPKEVLIAAVAIPCVIIISLRFWWWRSGRLGAILPSRFGLIDLVPGTRRVRTWSQAATFSELLRLLVESNLPLEQALRLAADAVDDRRFRAAAIDLAARGERGDVDWSANPNGRANSRSLPLLIRIALDQSSNRPLLVTGLRQAATIYRERAIRAAEWYSEYVPVFLTVGIAGTLTIAFTLSVLWPYAATLRELSSSHWH